MVRVVLFIFSCCITGLMRGQVYEFEVPHQLSGSINSDAPEVMPLLSSNGQILFFSRSIWDANKGGKFAGHDIWMSEKKSSSWTSPTNTEFLNTKGNDAIVGCGSGGDIVFLMRTFSNKRINGIYFSKLFKGSWTEPELIPVEGIESLGSAGFFMHEDGTVLLISMKSETSRGEEDIYISLKQEDGSWSYPKNLGSTINTSGVEISPFLSNDKRKLYFSSNGHKGLGGADIFVSQRLHESWETWTVPMNLGDKVNSEKFDAYFSIYGDTVSYFVSNREEKHTDIYEAKVTIHEFNPNRKVISLSNTEVAELIGESVNSSVRFAGDNATLTANQKELLWYIAKKLLSDKNVKIMLVASKQDNYEITAKRLDQVTTQLVSGGIEGSRIRKSKPEDELVEIIPANGEIELVLVK